jgi:hypothetical protein
MYFVQTNKETEHGIFLNSILFSISFLSEKIHIKKIDPSCCWIFYIRSQFIYIKLVTSNEQNIGQYSNIISVLDWHQLFNTRGLPKLVILTDVIFIQLNLAASKLTINLMLKINTQNTVNRACIWLKLVSVVIDNICTVRILYNSSINIGVTANKNMFSNNVQTLSGTGSFQLSPYLSN